MRRDDPADHEEDADRDDAGDHSPFMDERVRRYAGPDASCYDEDEGSHE